MYCRKQHRVSSSPSAQIYKQPFNTFECDLVHTDVYIESFEVKPIQSQPEYIELLIKTQLLSAQNPNEWRVKSRTCIDLGSLKNLYELVGDFLQKNAELKS
jgi:hypothetical protein